MLAIGATVRGALACGKALDENAWLQVPFVGIAVTVLVLQFQLYLNVPINQGVIALWALTVLAGCWCLWKGQVRASLRAVPWLPCAACAAVLAVQGYGVAKVGPNDYVGRSWSDQFNYTAEAEFFRGGGFDLDYQHLGQRAWLVRVVSLRNHRIGQSVLHAYHGVITRMDTRSQFMPTILLSCPLIVLAVYAAARRLGLRPWPSTLAGLFGGLAPGETKKIHGKIYIVPADVPELVKRYEHDFPEQTK